MRAGTKLALAIALLGAAVPAVPAPLAAQGFLEGFSYSGLRFSGIGADLGAVVSDRLDRAISGAVRVDYGYIAPHVRTLISASYFRANFNASELARFAQRLRGVVQDPTNDFSIDVGTISWTNVEFDLDLQYMFGPDRPVTPYVGLGLGAQFRHGSGAAIDNTFVADALSTIAADLNGSAGVEVTIVRDLRLTAELRASLSSGLVNATGRLGMMYRLPLPGSR
ncbi:MAG TPA: hypothetical protein VJ992_08720 [Gemmatimonadales bacterium]|nr:hypothetical protein [Gemmatimonadales bacterium]